SLLSWGFSLVFSGLLVREVVRRVPQTDYRAAGAAGYLGLGSVWALGLSSSAALLMATKGSIPASLLPISGVLPLSQTIFLWQSIVTAIVLMAVSVLVAYLTAPDGQTGRTAESYGIRPEPLEIRTPARQRPGEWLEYTPLLTIRIVIVGVAYLVQLFASKGGGIAAGIGREQRGDRSAISASGGERAEGQPRLGGADVQRRGGPAEPHQPVLDAAAPRALGRARPRPRRLRGGAAPRAPAGGPVLDVALRA